MKITVENTSKVITLVVNGHEVPARVWQGATESGIPVHCFVTRIAPEISESDPRIDELTAQFDRELQRQAKPRIEFGPIDIRFFID